MLTLTYQQVEQLDCLPALIQCVDPCGRLVGFLHAANRNDQVRTPEITGEQLEAYAQEHGGSSLATILTKLRGSR